MATTSPLEALGYPLFFAVADADLAAPIPRLDLAHRTRIRHLEGMQKEALVTGRDGTTWRLVSDEGEYLDGQDVAPCPLAFMATGMASGYANAVESLAAERGVDLHGLEVVTDHFYTMTGSALRGDMTGGALDPEVEVRVGADVDAAIVESLVEDAVAAAPVTALLDGVLENEFTLTVNGEPVEVDRVSQLDAEPLADEADLFEDVPRADEVQDPPLTHHTGETTEEFTGARSKYTRGESSSLASEQDRVLPLRGVCTRRGDGLRSVHVKLYSPQGSIFELIAEGPDGAGRAPDPTTYVAAGLGFCFMTQFGRYADIVGTELSDYRIVQDTHLAAGVPGESPPRAESVETHVFLRTPEGEAFARDVLDMSEQTCFLHALCRTDLDGPNVAVETV